MNILMLVIKNTAALDFALPVLSKIKRQNPQANVSVLYCTLSRNKILRESQFYSGLLTEWGILEYDFADFLVAPWARLKRMWRRLCSKSNWDSSPWDRRLRQFPGGRRVARLSQNHLNRLENFLTRKASVHQVLPALNPDIVLFNHTAVVNFYGREHFYSYFSSARKKVVLLPHAPHHSSTTAFTPFDEEGEALPDYCEFWMPFRFDRTWEKLPEKKSQFAYVGYPGLDSEWLERFKPRTQTHSADKPGSSRSDKSLRCLFIIRRFLPKGQPRTPSIDAFIYDYNEFSYYLGLVETALKTTGVEIELVVKPHPSNDFEALKGVFAESGIANWRIAQDSVYACLSQCDFVISLYSTIVLITAMAGIPSILLNTSTQSVVHQEDTMKELYTGLHFYLERPEELSVRLKEVIDIVLERRRSGAPAWNGDLDHLRYFYPDGATQRCLDRLGI